MSKKEEERMDEDRSLIEAMRAITISREYGSGGGEIATRLAQRLGWQERVSLVSLDDGAAVLIERYPSWWPRWPLRSSCSIRSNASGASYAGPCRSA